MDLSIICSALKGLSLKIYYLSRFGYEASVADPDPA
jgi:hypothetical protein